MMTLLPELRRRVKNLRQLRRVRNLRQFSRVVLMGRHPNERVITITLLPGGSL